MNSSPASMFVTHIVSVNGITAQATSAGAKASSGAITNRNLLAFAGTMISFRISLSASASGCSQPRGPTRFGPMRTWM